MEEDNARYERSAEMFREQTNNMEQTNNILAGFKDIFKDLAQKKLQMFQNGQHLRVC